MNSEVEFKEIVNKKLDKVAIKVVLIEKELTKSNVRCIFAFVARKIVEIQKISWRFKS